MRLVPVCILRCKCFILFEFGTAEDLVKITSAVRGVECLTDNVHQIATHASVIVDRELEEYILLAFILRVIGRSRWARARYFSRIKFSKLNRDRLLCAVVYGNNGWASECDNAAMDYVNHSAECDNAAMDYVNHSAEWGCDDLDLDLILILCLIPGIVAGKLVIEMEKTVSAACC
jgi:hypothetical protein